MYLHAAGRPLYGVVRAAVKDSNDDEDEVFLDSDGLESNTITLRCACEALVSLLHVLACVHVCLTVCFLLV